MSSAATSPSATAGNGQVDSTIAFIREVRHRVARVVVGQDIVVERLLIAVGVAQDFLCFPHRTGL